MFAVIKTGGKQYRVAAGDKLKIEKIEGEPGKIVQIGEVLVVGGDSVTLGVPTISGASVAAQVLEQSRGPKVIAFKKRRRKNSRRKRGYRHDYTVIRITEILTEGQKPSKVAKPRPEPKAKPKAAEAEGTEAETKVAPKAKAKAPVKKAAAKKPAAKAPAKKTAKPAAKSGKGKKK
jgi:large subunit ribosomal protein L21